jgi:hypothetical protein
MVGFFPTPFPHDFPMFYVALKNRLRYHSGPVGKFILAPEVDRHVWQAEMTDDPSRLAELVNEAYTFLSRTGDATLQMEVSIYQPAQPEPVATPEPEPEPAPPAAPVAQEAEPPAPAPKGPTSPKKGRPKNPVIPIPSTGGLSLKEKLAPLPEAGPQLANHPLNL